MHFLRRRRRPPPSKKKRLTQQWSGESIVFNVVFGGARTPLIVHEQGTKRIGTGRIVRIPAIDRVDRHSLSVG